MKAILTMIGSMAVAAALLTATGMEAATVPGWNVDETKSTLSFSGTQSGSRFTGKFSRFGAEVAFDPENPKAARITVTVDLTSASTGDKQRDGMLPGTDWFNTESNSKAVFQTTCVISKGGDAFEATGDLTLRGISKSVAVPFTVKIDGATAHAVGHANLVRTDFGVGQGPWASDQYVAFEVGVDFDIVATKGE